MSENPVKGGHFREQNEICDRDGQCGAGSPAMAVTGMWYEHRGRLRWLLTAPQLRAYLDERGMIAPSRGIGAA